MRLVITTGIYPPEVGGPAYYAKGLAEAFTKAGNQVSVSTYGSLKKLPTGVRHVVYTLALLPKLVRADAVIALDTFSVAVPAAFLCRIFRKILIIRTGGDFVWERYVERTQKLVPLPHFYSKDVELSSKERFVITLTKYALSRATVVFSTHMQRDVWQKPYALDLSRARIIANAVEPPLPSEEPRAKNFLWHVRPNAIKNGGNVHAAFEKAKASHPEIVLEEGTMPKAALLERIKSCYAVLLPSLTEISPNYVLDALRFHKPFIMDKYSGLAEWLSPYGAVVDPLDQNDIASAISRLAEPDGYQEALKKVSAFSFTRTYDDIARDFLALIAELRHLEKTA